MAYTFETIDAPNQTFTNLLGISDLQQVVGFDNATVSAGLTFTLPPLTTTVPTITTLNFPNAAQTQVVAINLAGSKAGITVDKNGVTHGFTDVAGVFSLVDAPSTAFNQLLGINDFGQQVGYSSTIPNGQTLQKAYVHQANGTFNYLTLPTNVNSQATGIDDSGDVVGFFQPTATTSNGFYLSSSNVLTILSVTGSTFTQALGINSDGQIAGFYVDAKGVNHGFLYSAQTKTYTTIDYPGSTSTTVNGIDNSGQIVGFYSDAKGNTHGFVGLPPAPTAATTYTFQKINAPNDTFTQLLGINDTDEIVGFHNATTASGLIFTLPAVASVPPAIRAENFPNAAQTMVIAINAIGSTAGIYVDAKGVTHGFTSGITNSNATGGFVSVDAPTTAFNQLLGINDNGAAVGYSSTIPDGQTLQKAYFYSGGKFTYLTLPTNVNSQATGVDDQGDIVGFFLPTATTSEAFFQKAATTSRNGNTPAQLFLLQAPGSTFTQALGINQGGQIVGFYVDSAGVTHGFLYSVATAGWTTIDYPGATATTVNGINDAGQVTGFFVDANGNTDGFVGTPPSAATLYRFQTINVPNDTFTQLLGVNDSGEVVGFHGATTASGLNMTLQSNSSTPITINTENFPNAAQTMVVAVNAAGGTAGIYVDVAGTTHGFTNIGGVFATVDAPKTAFNQLLGINDNGQEAGYSSLDKTGQTLQLAFVRQSSGAFTYLTLPTNVNSQATGIDDSGDTVGFYLPTATTSNGFYLTAAGKLTILSAPNSTFTQALGINQEGQVVGFFNDSAGVSHGFIYAVSTATWTTIDFPGATATTVNGINDLGQISGFYIDAAGNTDGFVGAPPGACILHNPIANQTIIMPSSMTSLTVMGSVPVTVVNSASVGATITGNGANGSFTMTVTGTINAGAGNNTVISTASNSTMTAADGNNTMLLTNFGSANTMTAGNGANQMFAFGSNETITAGTGANTLLAQITNSTVTMGGGNAFVFGGGNKITVAQPTAVVSTTVGSGNSVTVTGTTQALFFGNGTAYTIAGGTAQIYDTGASSSMKAGDGNMTMLATGGKSTLSFGNGNQFIGAGGGGNTVTVGAGASTIFATAGGNTVTAGDGNATFVLTGAGNSLIYGNGSSQLFLDGSGGNSLTVKSTSSRLDISSFKVATTGGDALNLKTLLSGVNVNADLSNLSAFLTTSFAGSDTLITATVGSATGVIADLHGVGQQSLSALIAAHAFKIA